ncbi:prolyl-tRNA synthetase associated domain-containing protein 1 [Paramisgurnus dabryanus]|uniref:prolyl-tRNA synthetase associated domain-containing protein 1 n=1 Tax=Paramisgurnus dabryanus TaxID=90735 RepID=UPI0031F33BD8
MKQCFEKTHHYRKCACVNYVFIMASVELRKLLEEFLDRLGIETICVDHPEVFTVDEMMPHVAHLSGMVTKNLFLKDKKKKSLWLLSARHDRELNLGDVAKRLGLGSGNLRLAEESLMLEKLKVGRGCATALSLFCDEDQSVKMVLDRDLTSGGHERVYFHPMTNSATMGLKPDDLVRFLKETNHEPIILNFDQAS